MRRCEESPFPLKQSPSNLRAALYRILSVTVNQSDLILNINNKNALVTFIMPLYCRSSRQSPNILKHITTVCILHNDIRTLRDLYNSWLGNNNLARPDLL